MINLLPPKRLLEIRTSRSNSVLRRYIELVGLSAVFLAAIVVGSYYFLQAQRDNTQKIVDLNDQKLRELEPVQKQAEDLSQTINTIAGLQSKDIQFSSLLTQIGGVMPPGAVLSGLQFSLEDLEAPLAISAEVEAQEKAAVLRNNLIESKLFARADIQNISSKEQPGATAPATTSRYKFTAVINAYFEKGATATGSTP